MDRKPVRDSSAAGRVRGALSVALVVLGSVLALVGGVTLYLREEVLDSRAFADRAVEAAHQPTVQHVLARQITVQLIEPAFPDALAGRPIITSAVRIAVTSKPFAQVIRLAALHGHRLLFQRNGGNAVFDIADAGKVVSSALQNLSPKLAKELPKKVDAVVLTLRKRSFAAKTLRISEHVRLLGYVLPPVALALLAVAIAIAPDRRRALTRTAVGIGIAGIVLAIALVLLRRYVVANVHGSGELTNSEARGAIDELWGAFLGDLMTWTLVITAVAWVVAAAASTVLAPYSPAAGLARLRAAVPRPVSSQGRAFQGALLLALGVFVVLKPTLALRIVAVLGGLLLVYVGFGELLSATAPAQPRERRRRTGLAASGAGRRRHGDRVCGGVRGRVRAGGRLLERAGEAADDVQRLRAAVQPAARRGRIRRNPQRDVGRRHARLADRQPGPQHRPAAERRDQGVQDLHPLRGRDPDAGRCTPTSRRRAIGSTGSPSGWTPAPGSRSSASPGPCTAAPPAASATSGCATACASSGRPTSACSCP